VDVEFHPRRIPAVRDFLMAHPAVMESFDGCQLAGLARICLTNEASV